MAVTDAPSGSFLFGFTRPEVTTVIRWVLRVVLVVFLAWVIRRKPDQDDDDEDDQSDNRSSVRARTASARSSTRVPQQRQYNTELRRRQGQAGGGDFDSVIDRMSKPKEMWEVRKSGEGPQIMVKRPPGLKDDAAGNTASTKSGADGAASSLTGLMASMGGKQDTSPPGASERPKLMVAPPKQRTEASPDEKMLHGHQRPVTFISWNQDGSLLFTCGKDTKVCVWSIPDGECLGSYQGHSGAVWACSVTKDSKWLVTSGADRLVIVWEARESRELARKELPGVVRSVEWAMRGSDGEYERFVTAHNKFGNNNPPAITIWRFDGTAIEELIRMTDLPSAASQVRWGRDDELVASAHENGELIFWSATDGSQVKRVKAHEEGISKFEFSTDRQLVSTASNDKSIKVWDLGASGEDWQQLYQVETDRPLNDVALGPISRDAAAGPPDGRPARCCIIAAGGQDVRSVTTTGSTTEQFNTLLFKLPKSEEFPATLEADGETKGHFGPVHTLAFKPDGSAIASGSEDGCVRLHFFAAASRGADSAAS